MNRTAEIQRLINIIGAGNTRYVIDIAGPNCSFNVGAGRVEYTIRTALFGDEGMTLEQRERIVRLVAGWTDVTRAYITNSDQQHIRICFNTTAEEARSRQQFGRVFA